MIVVKSVPKNTGKIELYIDGQKIGASSLQAMAGESIAFHIEIEEKRRIRKYLERLGECLGKMDFSEEQNFMIADDGSVCEWPSMTHTGPKSIEIKFNQEQQ